LSNRRVIVVDGTGLSMPDTPENQEVWPQSAAQKPGCGFPKWKTVVCPPDNHCVNISNLKPMLNNKNILLGHVFTFTAIAIWSVAFIGNKILLEYLTPIEVMIFRFVLAYFLLLFVYPKWEKTYFVKDELYFLLLGLLGIFLYFLLENFALSYTQASNVGIYMGVIPILTSLIAHLLTHDERISSRLILGFFVAIAGMVLVLTEGDGFTLRLQGDLLALTAAIVFSLYSVTLKLAPKTYHYIVVTRKSFFYGILLMLAYHLFSGRSLNYQALSIHTVSINILFLGIFASGAAFVLWNQGINYIGSISASNYIYLVPLLTSITGIIVLDEVLTVKMVMGGTLILLGLYLSQQGVTLPINTKTPTN
jgi:drug/metabolite transporter (DMT)-like permease